MSKYKDFDDDYEYEDEDDYEYEPLKKKKREPAPAPRGKQKKSDSKEPLEKKKKKKMKRSTMVIILVLEVVVLLILLLVWYIVNKMSLIQYNPIDRDVIQVNPDIDTDTKEVLEGYTNILLLGTDSRDNSQISADKWENHTDSIIVASINNKTKEVRLMSVYRDTILKITDPSGASAVRYDKATEAGWYYGIESTINMVNTNLDLDIQDYVMVNWNAMIDIVDAVGGIDIEIDDVEQYWINWYLTETGPSTGREYTNVEQTGLVHLDGIQATCYCRIRYGGGDDYRRTERQRTVIGKVLEKAKHMDISQIDKAVTSIFQNISTSLDMSQILDLVKDVGQYNIVETTGFPFEKHTDPSIVVYNEGSMTTDMVIPINLANNVAQAHKFLFGVETYVPSLTVQEISNKIVELTGIQ